MGSIEFGAKQAIVNCLKVREGERVVIVTDLETRRIADAMADQVRLVGAEPTVFIMEDFGPRPADGKAPLEFPDEIAAKMLSSQVSLYVAQCRPGELGSFRQRMYRHATAHKLRHAHMPYISELIMQTGMAADYGKIQALSKKVFDVVLSSREIKIHSPAGSDFTVLLDPARRWKIDDGDIKPGIWGNLPAGEVFTAPADGNGVVVVDGALSLFTLDIGLELSETPLCYELKNGWCLRESVSCKRADLKDEFIRATFETDEYSSRLGELGIGTNTELERLIGNFLQDEKFPGVHIALGDPHPQETGADWTSAAHYDGIIKNPTVTVDGSRTIMERGVFTI